MLSDDRQPEEQEHPRTHSCRWHECQQAFSTNAALIDHVISVHIRTLRPDKRSDLPVLRRIEERSGRIYDLVSKRDLEDLKPSLEGPALPSPPASSPSPAPSVSPLPPKQNEFPVSDSCQSGSPRVYNHRPSTQIPDAEASPTVYSLPFTPMKNTADPTFASMSSPAESHLYSPEIPKSPDLSQMISDAINNPAANSNRSPSASSSTSRESVEQHLTENLGNSQPRSEVTNLAKENGTPSQARAYSRQTWYQNVPKPLSRVQRPKRTSALVSTPEKSGVVSRPFSRNSIISSSLVVDSPGSEASSTPDWSQISEEKEYNHSTQNFPYLTQTPYESQPSL